MDKKTHILIIDDEEDIREILQFNLEHEGFLTDTASSAEAAMKILSDKHQLILLDVMMEDVSGFKFANFLRKSGNNTPIIFLTAKNTENDMLTGFSIGGDDYISKPFSVKEVVARVKNVLKRYSNTKQLEDIINIGNLCVNKSAQLVSINNSIIDLTKTEYNILRLLSENEGQTYSREQIIEKAWDNDSIVLDRTVDVHIARLRKKLGEYGKYIINRSGYGYTFNFSHN